MSNVKFNYFLKNNPNNKKELPIVMTIIMSGERTQMFTGLWTVKSKWNQKYSKVIGTFSVILMCDLKYYKVKVKYNRVSTILQTGNRFKADTDHYDMTLLDKVSCSVSFMDRTEAKKLFTNSG